MSAGDVTMAAAQQLEQPTTDLYERDFLAWTENQAEALRTRQVGAIDWVNLLEEVESMGVSQHHELRNCLKQLLIHLAKWLWQPKIRSSSWLETIVEQRDSLDDLMDTSPSLKGFALDEAFKHAWPKAVRMAAIEASLPLKTFPSECPWSLHDVLSFDWIPE